MGESLTQRRRVGDEGLRVVKPCQEGRTYTFGCTDGTSKGSPG